MKMAVLKNHFSSCVLTHIYKLFMRIITNCLEMMAMGTVTSTRRKNDWAVFCYHFSQGRHGRARAIKGCPASFRSRLVNTSYRSNNSYMFNYFSLVLNNVFLKNYRIRLTTIIYPFLIYKRVTEQKLQQLILNENVILVLKFLWNPAYSLGCCSSGSLRLRNHTRAQCAK